MAAAIPIIKVATAVYGVYSAYQGRKDAKKAGKDAEDLAAYNAKQIKLESEEQARRQRKEDQQKEGLARAAAHARGTKVSGSVSNYLEDMEDTNRSNVDWMLRAGQSRAYSELYKGKMAKDQAMAGRNAFIGDALTNVGSGVTAGHNAGWW